MRRWWLMSLALCAVGCGWCDDAPEVSVPPPAPQPAGSQREAPPAPSIGLETQPKFNGASAERRDLSSRGIPAELLVPANSQVLDDSIELPGLGEVPSLLVTRDLLRLEVARAPDLTMKQWEGTLQSVRVDKAEVTEAGWTLLWSQEERLGVAVWRGGVLCEARDVTKPNLKDALKLCETLRPLSEEPSKEPSKEP